VRAVLGATSYAHACAVSREHCGKAVSKQLYNILGKIREVDDVVSRTPTLQTHLSEASPELSFAVMSGGSPMRHNKRTAEGRAERVRALREHLGPEVTRCLEARHPGAQRDDVLDAFALAWTARRRLDDSCLRLGSETDATGLRMQVVA
jgi:predicted RNase H-like nuclease